MKRYYPPILLLGMMLFLSVANAQHLTSAKLYFKLFQFDKAEVSAVKATEKDPDDGEAWFVLGKARFELKKYPEMIAAFDKAVALDSEEYKEDANRYRLKVWADSYNAGVKYYQRGRDTASYFKTAIDTLKVAILAQPDSTRTHYICALAYYGNNQIGESIKLLNTSLEKNPRQPEELKLLARLHLQLAQEKADAKDEAGSKQEYAAAVTSFENLYALDKTDAENALSLIGLYERLGQAEKALALTRDAVDRNPNNAGFRYVYGVYFLKQEKFPEGIEQLRKVVEAGADSAGTVYADAMYNLGVAHLNWGVAMKKQSEEKADSAIKVKAKNFKEDLSYKEKFKAAVPYFEKAATMKTDDPAIWQQLGRLYANLNMPEKAEEAFKKYDAMNK